VVPVSTVAKRKDSAGPSLQSYDFEQSAGYWLILAARAYQKTFDEELAPYHLTYRQAQVLGWLVLDGDLSQVELADRMMIEPATLVGVLDRMERDGLIRRIAVPSDRRKKKIEISESAGEVWDKVIACAKRIRARAVEGLSDRQIKEFFKTLQTIMRNLDNSTRKAESK
jgi:MarR family transcriptional regulator for hemolysin